MFPSEHPAKPSVAPIGVVAVAGRRRSQSMARLWKSILK
jgi:hypothetical protein